MAGISRRARFEQWVREHRGPLYGAWAFAGGFVVAALWFGADIYVLRGAPLPRLWAILFFLSLWCWVALRFIALWIWAWVVMALAPASLAYPLRYYLDAWWLQPLLTAVIALSALTVVAVVAWELRRRRATSDRRIRPRHRAASG